MSRQGTMRFIDFFFLITYSRDSITSSIVFFGCKNFLDVIVFNDNLFEKSMDRGQKVVTLFKDTDLQVRRIFIHTHNIKMKRIMNHTQKDQGKFT